MKALSFLLALTLALTGSEALPFGKYGVPKFTGGSEYKIVSTTWSPDAKMQPLIGGTARDLDFCVSSRSVGSAETLQAYDFRITYAPITLPKSSFGAGFHREKPVEHAAFVRSYEYEGCWQVKMVLPHVTRSQYLTFSIKLHSKRWIGQTIGQTAPVLVQVPPPSVLDEDLLGDSKYEYEADASFRNAPGARYAAMAAPAMMAGGAAAYQGFGDEPEFEGDSEYFAAPQNANQDYETENTYRDYETKFQGYPKIYTDSDASGASTSSGSPYGYYNEDAWNSETLSTGESEPPSWPSSPYSMEEPPASSFYSDHFVDENLRRETRALESSSSTEDTAFPEDEYIPAGRFGAPESIVDRRPRVEEDLMSFEDDEEEEPLQVAPSFMEWNNVHDEGSVESEYPALSRASSSYADSDLGEVEDDEEMANLYSHDPRAYRSSLTGSDSEFYSARPSMGLEEDASFGSERDNYENDDMEFSEERDSWQTPPSMRERFSPMDLEENMLETEMRMGAAGPESEFADMDPLRGTPFPERNEDNIPIDERTEWEGDEFMDASETLAEEDAGFSEPLFPAKKLRHVEEEEETFYDAQGDF